MEDTLERCGHLPLAIAIVAGLNLKSDQDWQDVIKIISTSKPTSKTHDYRLSLFHLFEISIKQLNPKHVNLFRLLGVFKAVKISLQSIVSLWQIPELEAKLILAELNSKSLLTFENRKR